MTESDMSETRAAFEMGKLAKQSGLSPDEVHAKCQLLIQHEQGLETKPERAKYWNSLSYKEKCELVRVALSVDFYKVSVEQIGTGKRATMTVAAPLGTPYKDVVEKIRKEGS